MKARIRGQVKALARLAGVSVTTIHNRMAAGITDEALLLAPPGKRGRKPKLYNGKTLRELEAQTGISKDTIYRRITRGVPDDRITSRVGELRPDGPPVLDELDRVILREWIGRPKLATLEQLGKRFDVSRQAVHWRAKRLRLLLEAGSIEPGGANDLA